MKSSSLNDVSLYELALSATPPPDPLQVSPTTFKSMVSAMVDVLVGQRLGATIWIKLPKGETWQSEIQRLRQVATAPHTLYAFTSNRDEFGPLAADAPPDLEGSSAADADGLIDDHNSLAAVNDALASYSSKSALFPIVTDGQLKREYFVLVVSETFSGLVLAHRPHSNRSEEEAERRHPLLAIYSVDPATLEQVFLGLYAAIAAAAAQTPLEPEVELMMENWDEVAAIAPSHSPSPTVISHLLGHHIRTQEEIWHNTAAYRRQAETADTLQLATEELQTLLRIKDEFLQNVGQELRTPLATMKTALSLLNSPNLKPAQKQRYMDMLTQECDRQGALITSVLDLLQLETVDGPADIQPVRLSDIVPGIVSTFQPLAQEKGVLVAYTVADDMPSVSCTTAWLRQIIINLLHNGIKFTPVGGRVWVRAKPQNGYVQIDIADTGIGIAQADLPKIFDRFYRVRGARDDASGTGLGLSIVQELLVRCGGSISVKSRPGDGSTFTVLLPIAAAAQP